MLIEHITFLRHRNSTRDVSSVHLKKRLCRDKNLSNFRGISFWKLQKWRTEKSLSISGSICCYMWFRIPHVSYVDRFLFMSSSLQKYSSLQGTFFNIIKKFNLKPCWNIVQMFPFKRICCLCGRIQNLFHFTCPFEGHEMRSRLKGRFPYEYWTAFLR